MDLQDYVPPLPGIKGKSIRHIKTESWRGYGMLVGIRKIEKEGRGERRGEGEGGGRAGIVNQKNRRGRGEAGGGRGR